MGLKKNIKMKNQKSKIKGTSKKRRPKKYQNEAGFIINKIGIDKNTLAISPATNWQRKNWPIEHFTLLVETLLNAGFK